MRLGSSLKDWAIAWSQSRCSARVCDVTAPLLAESRKWHSTGDSCGDHGLGSFGCARLMAGTVNGCRLSG